MEQENGSPTCSLTLFSSSSGGYSATTTILQHSANTSLSLPELDLSSSSSPDEQPLGLVLPPRLSNHAMMTNRRSEDQLIPASDEEEYGHDLRMATVEDEKEMDASTTISSRYATTRSALRDRRRHEESKTGGRAAPVIRAYSQDQLCYIPKDDDAADTCHDDRISDQETHLFNTTSVLTSTEQRYETGIADANTTISPNHDDVAASPP